MILVFLFLNSLITSGQSVSDILRKYVSDLRIVSSSPIPASLLAERNALETMQASLVYYNDSSSIVRAKIYLLNGKIGTSSKQDDIRKVTVNQLMLANRDNDISNVGMLWDLLSQFGKGDFSLSARDTIRSTFKRRSPPLDKLLKLIGYLEIVELKEDIRPLTLPPFNKKDRWAALLSLSRMGDEESTQSILKRSRRLAINDDVLYEIFPDLIYTRQPVLINYMVTVLNSNEKNCLSADTENEIPILCGYRVMEQLAPIIEQYPLKLEASGDIDMKDYSKALVEVRNWFHQRGDNFKINKDRF